MPRTPRYGHAKPKPTPLPSLPPSTLPPFCAADDPLRAHRALCPRCAKSRLISTTSNHRSQGPEFCTLQPCCRAVPARPPWARLALVMNEQQRLQPQDGAWSTEWLATPGAQVGPGCHPCLQNQTAGQGFQGVHAQANPRVCCTAQTAATETVPGQAVYAPCIVLYPNFNSKFPLLFRPSLLCLLPPSLPPFLPLVGPLWTCMKPPNLQAGAISRMKGLACCRRRNLAALTGENGHRTHQPTWDSGFLPCLARQTARQTAPCNHMVGNHSDPSSSPPPQTPSRHQTSGVQGPQQAYPERATQIVHIAQAKVRRAEQPSTKQPMQARAVQPVRQ